jgi:hypothetical protein
MRTMCLGAVLLFCAVSWASADGPDPGVAAVAEIEGVDVDPAAFEGAQRGKPIEIKSDEEAAKYFKGEALKRLLEKVDFSEQFVLVFAWKGSGQDRLVGTVAESYPEQAFFEIKPGRTRDLRSHVRVYALRSNVTWKVK